MAIGGALIGALRVTLGLDSSQFEAGTKRARQVASRDVRAIQADLAKVRQGFENLRNAAVATALAAAGKRALDYASSLGEVAQQAGVSARELQEYRYAASQAGVSSDEMDKALAKLTRTIGEARAGSKEQATVFRDLGVAIEDATGRVYSAGEVIPKLADALSRIKDPATRARYEVDLFGKTGQKLDTMLAGGSEAIDELRGAAQKLGVVLSDSQIQNADDTADKLAALKQVLEARIAGVVADNANAILGLANALATLASAAVQAANKMPAALTILGGAAVGGRLAGAPGAMVGALGGLVGSLSYYAANDPFRVKNDSKESLIKRQRSAVKAIRELNRGGYGDSDEFKEIMAESNAIDAEIGRRLAAMRAPKAAAAPVVAEGSLPVVKSGGGGGGGGRRAGSKDRTQEYQERFERELASLQDEQLQFQQDITTDVREKARLEHDRIETTKAAYEHDLENRQKAGELTKAQAEELRLANERNSIREATIVNWRLDDELTEQELELTRARLESESTLLQGELDAARTQAERRRIQLAILDKERAMERASLEAVIARHGTTDVEKQIAQAKLDQLTKETGQRADEIRRDTMTPEEAYLDSLPRTADELKERFGAIKVDALNSGLDLAARNVVKLKGFAGDLFNQLIADVIRLNLQSAIAGGSGLLGSLGKLLLGLAGGAGSGGGMDMSGWDGAISGFTPGDGANGATAAIAQILQAGPIRLPGLAGGGSFRVGGAPGVDRNVLAINGIPCVRVSSNENIKVGYGADAGVARVEIVENPMFASRVVGISGNVAIETTRTNNQTAYRRNQARLA